MPDAPTVSLQRGLCPRDTPVTAYLGAMFEAVSWVWVVLGAVSGAMGWVVGGCAQWVVLKQHFNRAGWWVFATTTWKVSCNLLNLRKQFAGGFAGTFS